MNHLNECNDKYWTKGVSSTGILQAIIIISKTNIDK